MTTSTTIESQLADARAEHEKASAALANLKLRPDADDDAIELAHALVCRARNRLETREAQAIEAAARAAQAEREAIAERAKAATEEVAKLDEQIAAEIRRVTPTIVAAIAAAQASVNALRAKRNAARRIAYDLALRNGHKCSKATVPGVCVVEQLAYASCDECGFLPLVSVIDRVYSGAYPMPGSGPSVPKSASPEVK